jgi:hypothetical protein
LAVDLHKKSKQSAKGANMKAPKARNIKAPKARNMKARGKREEKRSASPLVRDNDLIQR